VHRAHVKVDATGDLFIADFYNNRIRLVSSSDALSQLRLLKTTVSGCLEDYRRLASQEPGAGPKASSWRCGAASPRAVVPGEFAVCCRRFRPRASRSRQGRRHYLSMW